MENFQLYTPTHVVFGRGTQAQAGGLARQHGATRALLHYGGKSALASGLVAQLEESLQAAGVACVQLGGVQPNPRLSLVRQGIALCQQEKVDFILAVGGGSVIDSAKAIAYGVANEGDVWDYFAGLRKPEKTLPMGVVLTIAAAGSEMSNSCVITNDDVSPVQKRGYNDDILGRPRFAVMNPELTLTVPAYHTAAGNADILMHTLERYLTRVEGTPMQLTDSMAEALMRTVLHNARLLARQPDDYDARAEVMWAGSLSHNGLTGCGNGGGDWACHQLGHELSARYDLTHGASLTTVWGSWARHVYRLDAARFAQLATHVLELPEEGTDEETALAGIEEMEGFFWAIEMPTSLSEAGIEPTDEELRAMAQGCSRGGTRTVGSVKKLDEADMLAIYTMAK